MASTIHGVRFVRCPKCNNVLQEPVDIPVYACGGCGQILRAKYSFTRENVGSIQSSSSIAPSSGTLENRLPPSLRETTHATGLENGVNEALVVDHSSAQPLPSSSSVVNIESLEQKECSVDNKDADKHTLRPDNWFAPERNEVDSSNVDLGNILESKEDFSLKTKVEKSLKLRPLGNESLNVSDERLDSTESNSSYFASDDDTIFHSVRHDNSWRSSKSRSLTYDDKMFSADNDHAHDGATSSSDSVSNADKAVGEPVVVNEMTVETQYGFQVDVIPTKLPNDSYELALTSTFDQPKYKSHTRKDTSLGSADFYSVQNWFEPESDGSFRSPVKDEVLDDDLQNGREGSSPSLEHVQQEILRKVDELKCEISDLFHASVENKDDSHLGGTRADHQTFDLSHNQLEAHKQRENFQQQCKFAQIASLLPLGTCLHCLHEGCQKPPQTSRNILCSDGFCRACSNNILSHSYNKVQKHDQNIEGSDHKGKMKHAKHHCRPVLGGAPFIICYNCLRLLQLPLDFLVTMKQFYRLQCGACAKILKFSFRNRYCSVTQTPIQETPKEVKHPPSEVDSTNDSIPELEITPSEDGQQHDHVSYYQEYPRYLADIEPPLHVSRNSSDSMELKNGRLHRLMGYGSASHLLFHHSDSDEGFDSSSVSEEGHVRNKLKGKEIYIPQYSERKQSRFHQNSR